MGDTIPPDEPTGPDYEVGEDCLDGWPAGWTPKYLTASFSGIEKCQPSDPFWPIPASFPMQQDPFHACAWIYEVEYVWSCYYHLTSTNAILFLFHWAGLSYFYGGSVLPEKSSFINTVECHGIDLGGFNGTGSVG